MQTIIASTATAAAEINQAAAAVRFTATNDGALFDTTLDIIGAVRRTYGDGVADTILFARGKVEAIHLV